MNEEERCFVNPNDEEENEWEAQAVDNESSDDLDQQLEDTNPHPAFNLYISAES